MEGNAFSHSERDILSIKNNDIIGTTSIIWWFFFAKILQAQVQLASQTILIVAQYECLRVCFVI